MHGNTTSPVSLSSEDITRCNEFREARNRFGMTQPEWAKAIGISLALVQKIELHQRKCSNKTIDKVRSYEKRWASDNQSTSVVTDLESRIICDILLSHMSGASRETALPVAVECTKAIKGVLDGIPEDDSQEMLVYCKFLSQVIHTFRLSQKAVLNKMETLSKKEDILNSGAGLRLLFKADIVKRYTESGSGIQKFSDIETLQISMF